ncbi:MAG: oligosaccharide flippase family protein, partial [Lachnospiraceae bacterium]|nr:oligosaccharide flippase family protein [Lachnospiraceae bacterium]
MSREAELVKNTTVLSIGRFLPKLCAFVTLPILTACLTKAEYGTYDLIATLVMLVIPIATLQIQSAAFRFLIDVRGDREASSEIISNIFVVTIPVTVVASFVIQFFFRDFDAPVRILITCYFLLDTVYLTLGQICRGLGKNRTYSIAAILLAVVYTICIVIAVYAAKGGLTGVLASLCVSQLAGITYLAMRTDLIGMLSPSKISGAKIRELLAYSWPMVPNNLSTWVLKLSDRLVITYFLGIEANAVYAVANKIPNMLSIAQSVMVMAWHENASVAAKDKDASEYYAKMLDKVFSFMFGCTALLIAATPILFVLLIRGDYDDAYCQMPVLILAMFFFVMSSYFGGIYIAHKKTVNVGISTMVAAGINLLIDLCFVNVIGIWAGSISTLTAYVVLYYYRMFNSRSFRPFHVDHVKQ